MMWNIATIGAGVKPNIIAFEKGGIKGDSLLLYGVSLDGKFDVHWWTLRLIWQAVYGEKLESKKIEVEYSYRFVHCRSAVRWSAGSDRACCGADAQHGGDRVHRGEGERLLPRRRFRRRLGADARYARYLGADRRQRGIRFYERRGNDRDAWRRAVAVCLQYFFSADVLALCQAGVSRLKIAQRQTDRCHRPRQRAG